MCKYGYEKIFERIGKPMIFCKLKSMDNNLLNICIGQKFCGDKGKYLPHNQKKNCKYYED